MFSNPLESFQFGITPVVTISYPQSNASNSSTNVSGIHLNCMKVVGSQVGATSDGHSAVSGRTHAGVMGLASILSFMVFYRGFSFPCQVLRDSFSSFETLWWDCNSI
jgi:hypothetical protein